MPHDQQGSRTFFGQHMLVKCVGESLGKIPCQKKYGIIAIFPGSTGMLCAPVAI